MNETMWFWAGALGGAAVTLGGGYLVLVWYFYRGWN